MRPKLHPLPVLAALLVLGVSPAQAQNTCLPDLRITNVTSSGLSAIAEGDAVDQDGHTWTWTASAIFDQTSGNNNPTSDPNST